jgi:superfamily II DNA or RNA helicase
LLYNLCITDISSQDRLDDAEATLHLSLRQAETDTHVNAQRTSTSKRVREALETQPSPAAVERVDRLRLFMKLLRNIRLNQPLLEESGLALRINQLRAVDQLIAFLAREGDGGRTGYFRQPTGAGKTILLGIIARLLGVKTLILVPRVNLVTQTRDELVSRVGFAPEEIGCVADREADIDRLVTVATYQSHVRKMATDTTYRDSVTDCEVVICDEAHRSLGDATRESIEELDGTYDDLLTEEEQEAEDDVLAHLDEQTSRRALMLGFTATPTLAVKDVEEYFPVCIGEERHTDLVRAGILVPYRIVSVDGQVREEELDGRITEKKETEILQRNKTYDHLLEEYVRVLEDYRTTKTQEDYPLHGVVFCVNIDECDRFKTEAEEKGLRCRIVTGREARGQKGHEIIKEAEYELLEGAIDLIVTVDKLGEGWNFPPANAAIWARATKSAARVIQGIGRVCRSYADPEHGPKEYAYVFETRWRIRGGKQRRSRPLGIAEALACNGEDPEQICTMQDGSTLDVERVVTAEEIGHEIRKRYTPEEWAAMRGKDKGAIDVFGLKLTAIARVFCTPGQPVGYYADHLALGRAIWGEAFGDPETMVRERLRSEIQQRYTPEQWAGMERKEKNAIDVFGLKLMAIATRLGVPGHPAIRRADHIALGKAVWGEAFGDPETMVCERLRAEIRKRYTPEEWAAMRNRDKGVIDVFGLKLAAIARTFGVPGHPAGRRTDYFALGRVIFGEHPALLETTMTADTIAEEIRQRYTPEEWAGMVSKEKQAIEVFGLKLTTISTRLGIPGHPAVKHADHLALGRVIWGEIFRDPEEANRNKLQIAIQQRYTPEQWANMGQEERRVIDVFDLKLTAIARTFGVPGSPINKNADHLALGRAIFGEHPALVEITPDVLRAEILRRYTSEQWAALKTKDKATIDIFGLKLKAIAGAFGIRGAPIGNHADHLALGRVIFGESGEDDGAENVSGNEQNEQE